MVYTEVQKRGGKRYYYRTVSERTGKSVSKKRKYMGANLGRKELARAEQEADRELGILGSLLTPDEIELLDLIREEYAREQELTRSNRYEAFATLFTHNSTAIEGNTLSLQETGDLLFDGIAPSGKSMIEINEILGHKRAFDVMLEHEGGITRKFILELHGLVMEGTLSPEYSSQIGKYRTVQVYIRGVEWTPPGPGDVPADMKALLTWYSKNRRRVHPLVLAVYFHIGFEIVHPFIDGNGRVGRLLLNLILHRNGYPMVNIPNSGKYEYYDALQEAQDNGNLRPFIDMMLRLLKENDLKF